jgi:hypothetical protein
MFLLIKHDINDISAWLTALQLLSRPTGHDLQVGFTGVLQKAAHSLLYYKYKPITLMI